MAKLTTGSRAEAAVAEHLKKDGFNILNRNWKTKVCELDIVARKKDVIYYVEVKYRQADDQGGGLEHITPHKLNQLKFAARICNQDHNYDGDYRIIGAEVSGSNFSEINLVEID